jgi:hypothetical protein
MIRTIVIDPLYGVILSQPPPSQKVTNGKIYDKGVLDISKYQSIIVPDNASISRRKIDGIIEIYLEKELAFFGHPPYPIHIRDAREYMGCAYKDQGTFATIATYGEWWSKEGGANIRMLIVAPKGLNIIKYPGLSGESSKASPPKDMKWMKLQLENPQFKKCYWYVPITPCKGWTPIDLQPDDKCTAKKSTLSKFCGFFKVLSPSCWR